MARVRKHTTHMRWTCLPIGDRDCRVWWEANSVARHLVGSA